MSPTFSIVVPCHNYARFVPTTINSVLAQGRQDVEIIFVDDASTDDSADIARSYRHPVRVVSLEQNVGPGAAWGIGLAEARGRYVCKLDADDWQLPGFLDRVEREFERHDRIGLVATGAYLYPEDTGRAFVQSPARHDRVLDESALRRRLLRKFFVRMPSTALRRAAFEGHAPPRTDLRLAEDWEAFLRVLRGWRASLITEPLAVYRIHGASLTLTSHSSDRLRDELTRLLAITRDAHDPAYLAPHERRRLARGVAESYLGIVGPRLSGRDVLTAVGHVRVAASLAASEHPVLVASLLPYLARGAWQRLVSRQRRPTWPIESLLPRDAGTPEST